MNKYWYMYFSAIICCATGQGINGGIDDALRLGGLMLAAGAFIGYVIEATQD